MPQRPQLHAWLLILLILPAGLAGCLGGDRGTAPAEPPPSTPDNTTAVAPPNVTISSVGSVASANPFEPTVAAGPSGTVYVAGAEAPSLHVSTDGGETWERRPIPPPTVDGARALPSDAVVRVDAEGRLWYVALVPPISQQGPTAQGGGVQIATSEDGGQTWASNHYVGPPDYPWKADRPWITFGPDGTTFVVWTAFQGFFDDQHLVAVRSMDGGAELSSPVEVTPPAPSGTGISGGRGIVTSNGTLVVPYLRFVENGSLSVARSTDGGEDFEVSTVWRPSDGVPGSHVPVARLDARDRVHVVWNGPDDRILHTVASEGGRAWRAPVQLEGLGGQDAAGPGFEIHDGAAWVSTYGPPGQESILLELTVFPANATEPNRVTRTVSVAQPPIRPTANPAFTDFADLAVLPSGGTLVVWANPETGRIALASASLTGG